MKDMNEMLSEKGNPFLDPDYEIDTNSEKPSTKEEIENTKLKTEASPRHEEGPVPKQAPEAEAEVKVKPTESTESAFQIKPTSWHQKISSHFHYVARPEQNDSQDTTLQQGRHKGCDLATVLKNYKLRSDDNDYAKALKEDTVLDLETGKASDIEVLNAYFALFDSFFFLNWLAGHRRESRLLIELVSDQKSEFHGRCACCIPQDLSLVPAYNEAKTTIMIEISQNGDRETRLKFYLEALLHQMIHAFFAIYGCRVRDCNKRSKNEGKQSHGEAWQEIAFHIEQKFEGYFGFVINLNRKWAYILELASCRERIVPEKARGWGFDVEELAKEVECCLYGRNTGLKKGCISNPFLLEPTLGGYSWRWDE